MKKFSLLMLPLALLALGSCDQNAESSFDTKGEMKVMPVNMEKGSRGYSEGTDFYETLTAQLHNAAKEQKARTMQLSTYLYPQEGEQGNYFVGNTFAMDVPTYIWRNYNAGIEDFDPVYWPVGGQLDFLAYSLSEPKNISVEWNKENAASSVVLTVPGENTQNDILYSSLSREQQTKTSGMVNMTFKHAQAWLEFVVTGVAKDYEGNVVDKAIKFVKIELENVYNAGKLSIYNNLGNALADWDFSGVVRRNVVVDNVFKVDYLSTQPQFLDILVPEQQKNDFVLYYQFEGYDEVLKYRFSMDEDTWLMGNKYVYTINVTSNEITVVPSVAEWNLNDWITLNNEQLRKIPAGANPADFALLVNGKEVAAEPILYNVNDSITLEAVCSADYQFYKWSDNKTENPRRIAVKDWTADVYPIYLPIEAIPHAFTVNASGKEVFFAKGNLYADKSSGSLKFGIEDEQYYFRSRYGITDDAAKLASASTTPENTSGLFQWDVNAADFGAFGIAVKGNDITGTTSDVLDFGPAYGPAWTTLTIDEWGYIIDHAIIKPSVEVCGVLGALFAPDDFEGELKESYTDVQWTAAENDGIIFLPAGGFYRDNKLNFAYQSLYWSKTAADDNATKAHRVFCGNGEISLYNSKQPRLIGMSVRLVCE